jgi:hypothetical protein
VTPFYPQKLALLLPTSCSRSVGIVRWRTKSTEFVDNELRQFLRNIDNVYQNIRHCSKTKSLYSCSQLLFQTQVTISSFFTTRRATAQVLLLKQYKARAACTKCYTINDRSGSCNYDVIRGFAEYEVDAKRNRVKLYRNTLLHTKFR